MKKPAPFGFSGLHLLLALSLPFVLAFLLGCKRAKEERADLGPAVNAKEIDDALSKVISTATLDGLRVGEYINYVVLRRIENGDKVMLMGGTNVAVIAAKDSDDQTQTKFTLQINKSFRKDDGSFRNVTSEDPLVVKKPGVSLLAHSNSLSELNAQALTTWAQSVSAKASEQPLRTTFHHLREGDEVLHPPDKVRLRPDCGGLPSCEIPMHYIRFEMALWYSDTDYQKISLDFGFSNHTPFLPFGEDFNQLNGLLIVDCRSTYVQFESRNVYVRDCQQLEDFQK